MSSHSSPKLSTPSPHTAEQSLGRALKPASVSWKEEPVIFRSAWKMLILYTLPAASPKAAGVERVVTGGAALGGVVSSPLPSCVTLTTVPAAASMVTDPVEGTCRPPRSTARLPLMNTQTSSSPRKVKVARMLASYVNQYSTSVVK